MIKNPCDPKCAERSAVCHAECEKYKAYRAALDKQSGKIYKKKRMTIITDEITWNQNKKRKR